MLGAAAETKTADHRRDARQRAFLGGKLVYGDGAFTVDCVVRDISTSGARLKLPDGQAVPDRVYLVETRSGIAYEAKVVWKRHPEIGLEFVHQHGLDQPCAPHLMILKRLWMESRERSGI